MVRFMTIEKKTVTRSAINFCRPRRKAAKDILNHSRSRWDGRDKIRHMVGGAGSDEKSVT